MSSVCCWHSPEGLKVRKTGAQRLPSGTEFSQFSILPSRVHGRQGRHRPSGLQHRLRHERLVRTLAELLAARSDVVAPMPLDVLQHPTHFR